MKLFRSIGTRLTLWYSGLLVITLVVVVAGAFWFLSFNLDRDIDRALDGIARVMAERDRASASRFSTEFDSLLRRHFGFSPLDRYFEMLDPSGRRYQPGPAGQRLLLSEEAARNAAQGTLTFETITGTRSHPLRLLTYPVLERGRVVNIIQVGMSLEQTEAVKTRFLAVMLGVLPIGVLLAGGGGWLLARRALKPVDDITQAADRISGRHLTERLRVTGSGDELDRLARTLNRMLERLDSAFDQIRRFSADASHELQTPLTVMRGELELALRTSRSADEYRRTLESALEEVGRLSRLTEGLMLLARADAGALRLNRQEIDLDQLCQDLVADLAQLGESEGVDLRIDSDRPLKIQGDASQLRRLLTNLVQNGIKYTPRGGRVSLAWRTEGDQVAVEIHDTGIGLSRDESKRIFDRFYRASAGRSEHGGGAGLGLNIASSIATAHGGSIGLDSKPGKGSIFTVRLPSTSRESAGTPHSEKNVT